MPGTVVVFTHIIHINSATNSEIGVIIISILQKRKLRLEELNDFQR